MADGGAILKNAGIWHGMGDFHPPRLLRNSHVQSILPCLPGWRPRVLRGCGQVLGASRSEILDCGDGVRLLALRAAPRFHGSNGVRRTALLLHGWEGSADSPDIVSLGQHLFERGFEVIRLNLRDHGGTHGLNPGIFHSCRLPEVVGAVRRIQLDDPRRELSLVGFSLGGNFCLRVAAAARDEGLNLAHVVAVCPVVDPVNALARLDASSIYRRHFINRWRRSLLLKALAWPGRYNFGDLLRMKTLTEMTDRFVSQCTTYRALEHYLTSYALVGESMRSLDADTWLIAATDDPILPVADIDRLPSLDTLRVTRTRFGGHCGFIEARSGPGWLAQSIERRLSCASA